MQQHIQCSQTLAGTIVLWEKKMVCVLSRVELVLYINLLSLLNRA